MIVPSIKLISQTLLDQDTLAIGFSISSGDEADPVIKAVNGAKDKGAKTIMISSNPNIDLCESCDELMLMPEKKNREIRHSVSPKLPMMMIIEILYVHCLNLNWNEPKLVSVERGIIKERVVIQKEVLESKFKQEKKIIATIDLLKCQ